MLDIENVEASFGIPGGRLEELMNIFEFRLKDPGDTSLFKKGAGIQSTAILSSFLWVTEREVGNGQNVIWLIEEPEAFLHPKLNAVCRRLLNKLQEASTVVMTTHSLGFVPQDNKKTRGVVLDGVHSKVVSFRNYRESTDAIRRSIGVRFSDFYNTGLYNILVEGPGDKEYFEWVIRVLPPNVKRNYPHLLSPDAHYLDFGGVKFIGGFLMATWEYIREEVPAIVVLDGDFAGIKVRQDIQQYFGNKGIAFTENQDFVSVHRLMAIESLFPDDWIKSIREEHSGWFDEYSVDAAGDIETFKIKEGSKGSYARKVKLLAQDEVDRGEFGWAARWIVVLNVIEASLAAKSERLLGFRLAVNEVEADVDLDAEDEVDVDLDADVELEVGEDLI
ncbi:ATP-dependent nuclease [Vogesella indigofera]|uniref:ATP-dependent nuclease n=1 Tax=Vogesella indigofera TaxID=45465 RepID=UPI00234DC700|nr:AAA family ATPase [Vogesella indigofera]MDC7704818.1 AAA family ATPase [Vogesella indigofera]